MEYPIEQTLAKNVSGRMRIGYLLVDRDLRILAANDMVASWSVQEERQVLEQCLTDVLPEFVGMEPTLGEIIQKRRKPLILPRVKYPIANEQFVYVDIQVESFDQFDASLLITLVDVTEQAMQEQRLQQQRNELGILSHQLATAREQLAFVLERFVPATVAQSIVETRQLPAPGEIQHCQATILFADMRDFTKVAEAHSPNQTLDILNAYLTVIIDAIQKFDGSIVQIVGDMIMATFNVPQTDKDHALRSIQAALYTAEELKRFRDGADTSLLPKLGFGIGICSGFVTAGYLGATQRYRYAVVGDATNVAFHLCARAAAGQILAAESTVKTAVSDNHLFRFRAQLLESTTLKRRRESVKIYEIKQC